MFDRILIPLDGSQMALCALSAAFGLASTFDSEIELVHVLSKETPDTTTQIDPLLWHMRKAEIETYLSSIAQRSLKYELQVKRTILEGDAAERIIAHVAAQDINLIVMSSHGNSGMSGWSVSSVAQKIIARANRSIMLVRAFQQLPATEQQIDSFPFKNLLVPLDGSRRAEGILPIANKLAADHEATVWLVHVTTPSSLVLPFQARSEEATSQSEIAAQYKHAAAGYLRRVQSQLECRTKTAALEGDAIISTLNHFAEREAIDLMLLCAHGHSNAKQPYGTVVTSAIINGNVSVFIFQDLSPIEIEPTHAEIVFNQQANVDVERAGRHAQPAFWTA